MARTPLHPVEILADELKETGVSAAQPGRILHVSASRITQILNGNRGITADTALRLGKWPGTGGEFWMNLQKSYELRLAQQEIAEKLTRFQRRSLAA